MKKFALGFIIGGAVCAAVGVPVLLSERVSKFEYGYFHGHSAGKGDAASALEREFGRYDGQSAYKRLFSVSTTDVIVVETNGIKTVRVIP